MACIVPGGVLARGCRPTRRNPQYRKALGERVSFRVAGDTRWSCAYESERQVVLFRERLQFARKTARVRSFVYSQKHTASRRWILPGRIAGGSASCLHAPYVNHFVRAYFFKNTVQAAPARPLLGDEGNGRRAWLLRFFQSLGNMQQCLATKPITNGRPRPSLTDGKLPALQRHGI